ncbi:hypothetical protein DDB_G0285615 [Dictyostelium discoideum AX4]|uniref:Uncharacterized protein DDB_G0285615 n=1 Tax=Dictyostelium discoideum TaxID=44689 RepID=Y3815_DICDI|nr:hypothetical protein DDB_G0285615 [Dictyostelium discoideum AX4]Q54MX8.1 RecName: Full=Uncharacterized protein DDB_G0285615; Flags: Precursor [Dictyostelium discoideum]EAL64645.1 hypothetical protein DDB_G0285615 [Dictyostelium discoideum AX4]|eukprot:XP_638165.1 hypothetical protein DDB_G0285615 [Dictyostelium discoideum AX4]
MFKLNFKNNYKVLTLLFSLTLSMFVSNAQVYYPGYLNNVSSISTVSADYFPLLVHNPPLTNSTTYSFNEAINLLDTVTDPIFNATQIQALLNTWASNVKAVIGLSLPIYVTQLNRINRIDLLSIQMYTETNSAFILSATTYAPLKPQGVSILNQVNAIKASLNGITLTTTQQAQLTQFNAAISKIQLSVSNSHLITFGANDVIPFNSDSLSYMEYIADDILTLDDAIDIIKQNNVRILNYIYDLYSTHKTLSLNF